MQMVRQSLGVSLVLALAVVSFVPSALGVEQVERELDEAARTLEDIEAALAAAEREIAAAEERLRHAESALDEVAAERAAAEAAVADAEQVRIARTRALEQAEQAHADAQRTRTTALERLQDRSVEVFKYGASREQQAFAWGVIGARDWHEVAVSTSAVARIVVDDRALLEEAVRAREAAEAALVTANDARVAAVAAEQQASEQGARLDAAVEEHEAALAALEQEHRERQAVIDELEADSELVAMLVAKLENELARAIAAAEAEAAEAAEAARRAAEAKPPDPEPAEEPEPEPGDASRTEEPDETHEPGDGDPPAEPEPAPAPSDPPSWVSRLPDSGKTWAPHISDAASKHGIDPRLFAALVWTESSFNPNAVSRVGAIGLAQLMPLTAASLGVDPWDPIQNLDGGARYLAQQYQRFGTLELALAAYNAGPTAVANAGPGVPNYLETQLYIVRVLERYNHLHGS